MLIQPWGWGVPLRCSLLWYSWFNWSNACYIVIIFCQYVVLVWKYEKNRWLILQCVMTNKKYNKTDFLSFINCPLLDHLPLITVSKPCCLVPSEASRNYSFGIFNFSFLPSPTHTFRSSPVSHFQNLCSPLILKKACGASKVRYCKSSIKPPSPITGSPSY